MSQEEMFQLLLNSGLYKTYTLSFTEQDLSILMEETVLREQNFRRKQMYFESEMFYDGSTYTMNHKLWELQGSI